MEESNFLPGVGGVLEPAFIASILLAEDEVLNLEVPLLEV